MEAELDAWAEEVAGCSKAGSSKGYDSTAAAGSAGWLAATLD